MERRSFVAAGMAAGVAGMMPTASARAMRVADPVFGADFAPHFGMFAAHAGPDVVDQLKWMHERGFRSLEDNGMRGRPVEEQERIAREMTRLGMRMGVFVVNPSTAFNKVTFASGDAAFVESFLADVQASIEVAKRVNAKWMTVVMGDLAHRLEFEYQTANAVEILRRASGLLEPHGLVMVLEPLNRRDHPGMFLTRVPQAYQICRAVNSPACKILFDIYHQQITEGNLIPNFDRAWGEVAYVQIGDNPGRREPGTGEINYARIFAHLKQKGFTGILGMEHGNSKPGKDGELAVVEAYRKVSPA
ncbi:MAG: TIM barrel protein [Gemmatimonadales bacterium]|nr:TIM barrel protein [Gemmatimonadales bacterium]